MVLGNLTDRLVELARSERPEVCDQPRPHQPRKASRQRLHTAVCNALKMIHSNAEKVIHLRLPLTIRSGHFDSQHRPTLHKILRFSFLEEAILGGTAPALSLENHSWGFLGGIF